jgi:hypothetical protein
VIFTTADGLAQERETVLDRVVHVEEGAILEVPAAPAGLITTSIRGSAGPATTPG